jgi:branched-chain amino acid transport system ATP-binding protein
LLLEVDNLWVHYGKAEALRGVSLSVAEGGVVTLIGANGAGKTTLMKAISGLQKPTSGEIRFQGERIDSLSAHQVTRRGIAHCPEGRRLFYKLTVLQNLEMGGYLANRSQVKERIEIALTRFPALRDRLKNRGSDLSGGEQQMVAVARAMMSNPKVLLLDEPSLGLSPLMVEEIANIVREISKLGVTILLVEQNAYMALELAQTAYVLEVGSVALCGDCDVVGRDEYVRKAYLGA